MNELQTLFLVCAIAFTLAASAPAQTNSCLEFDNDTSIAVVNQLVGLETLNESAIFTFECWLRPRSQGEGGRGRLLEQRGGKLTWYLSDDERFGFRAGEKGGWRLSNKNAISYWEWQHIAVSSDGRVLRFFVDGKLVGRVRKSIALDMTSDPLWIGNGMGPDKAPRGFDGWIDELRVSSIARYLGEFTPARELPTDTSTVMHFSFDEPLPSKLALDKTVFNAEVRLADPLHGTANSPRRSTIE